MNRSASLLVALAIASPAFVSPDAFAQPSNVSPNRRYAWNENAGWINFRDAGNPQGAQGVRLAANFLAGFAWGENVGWINFGDGTPADTQKYANASGADFGVNREPSGDLSGLAWGENVGWINFGWASVTNPQRPRLDSGRLRGYAWSENLGWINLDDATRFVAFNECPADVDDGGGLGSPDGGVTIEDLLYYLVVFGEGSIAADMDDGSGTGTQDGGVTIEDLLYFLLRFEGGC